jgi:hypothetical protein
MLYIEHKKISPFFLWNRKGSPKVSQDSGTGPDSLGSIPLPDIDSCLPLMWSPAKVVRDDFAGGSLSAKLCVAARTYLFLLVSGREIFLVIAGCYKWIRVRERRSREMNFCSEIKVLPWCLAAKEPFLEHRICVDFRRPFSFLPFVLGADQVEKKKAGR